MLLPEDDPEPLEVLLPEDEPLGEPSRNTKVLPLVAKSVAVATVTLLPLPWSVLLNVPPIEPSVSHSLPTRPPLLMFAVLSEYTTQRGLFDVPVTVRPLAPAELVNRRGVLRTMASRTLADAVIPVTPPTVPTVKSWLSRNKTEPVLPAIVPT